MPSTNSHHQNFIERNEGYYKNYYKDNKERYLTRTMCACGKDYAYANKSKHLKTKCHKKYVLQSTPPVIEPPVVVAVPEPSSAQAELSPEHYSSN
jgi:hypothetical protein